jgi:simple sugar transport system ATP-binding protein
MASEARRMVAEYDIRTPSIDAPMWSLSGGNQQRVILARELDRAPLVLVAAQPTQGLDVGAIEDMWDRLRRAAQWGAGVLLISTELDEVLALADRIAVIQKGSIVGEMECVQLDSDRLALLMGGEAA